MIQIAYKEFLGNSPGWFKNAIPIFLVLSLPLKFMVGTTILGWLFIAMFILTLAMALKCYPLQSGGLLGIAILALGLTSPETVWHEIQANLAVIALLIFMVSFIFFMKPLLSFVFARITERHHNVLFFCRFGLFDGLVKEFRIWFFHTQILTKALELPFIVRQPEHG